MSWTFGGNVKFCRKRRRIVSHGSGGCVAEVGPWSVGEKGEDDEGKEEEEEEEEAQEQEGQEEEEEEEKEEKGAQAP